MFTEILEYANALRPLAKGQEQFAGFPHLLAYKLLHSRQLLELGYVDLAKR